MEEHRNNRETKNTSPGKHLRRIKNHLGRIVSKSPNQHKPEGFAANVLVKFPRDFDNFDMKQNLRILKISDSQKNNSDE